MATKRAHVRGANVKNIKYKLKQAMTSLQSDGMAAIPKIAPLFFFSKRHIFKPDLTPSLLPRAGGYILPATQNTSSTLNSPINTP